MTPPNTDEQGRPLPPLAAAELETLAGFLDFQRATITWKTAGLDDDQLRQRLEVSTMTLGGLLMHLAFVEDYWFSYVMTGQAPVEPFQSADWDADPDADWRAAESMAGDDIRAFWRDAVERSTTLLAELSARRDGLGVVEANPGEGAAVTLRWVLVHMIEEYARHAGHADLIREGIDGLVGE